MARIYHLLTCKELAEELRKHVNYVYAMRRRGFPMPGDVATITDALNWLQDHPQPTANGHRRRSKRKV